MFVFLIGTFYQPPKQKQRSSGVGFFLFVFLALPLAFACVAAVQAAFAVASAGLGRGQRLHAQDLVYLSEGEQPQSLLEREEEEKRDLVSLDPPRRWCSCSRPGVVSWFSWSRTPPPSRLVVKRLSLITLSPNKKLPVH